MFRFLALLACLLFKLLFASFVSEEANSCSHHVLSVYDLQGGPIAGLAPADFEAKVRGKPVKILTVAPDIRPHRIVVIVDASHGFWRWKLALARHFFDQNHRKAQIALLIFGKHTNEVIDFSQGSPAVNDALEEAAKGDDHIGKDSKGATLQDAILQGIRLFDRPTSADALYVLTDAIVWDVADRTTTEAVQRLISTGVRLFAVYFEEMGISFRGEISQGMLGYEELSEMARKSGGGILSIAQLRDNRLSLSVNAEGKAATEETLTHLYDVVLRDSILELEIAFPVKKNDNFELKLSDNARRQWKSARIFYSKDFTGCASSSNSN